jgi:hypothetical protein
VADDGGAAAGGRTMENMPVVDLSGVRDRAEVAGLRLRNIGLVLVPDAMPDLVRDADAQNVGTVRQRPAPTPIPTTVTSPGATQRPCLTPKDVRRQHRGA